MTFFNIARVFTYPAAALILLAYVVVGYAIYAHVNRTWPIDDPRMMIPAPSFLAMLLGVALSAFCQMYHRKMMKYEFYALACIAALGVVLLPGMVAAAYLLDR